FLSPLSSLLFSPDHHFCNHTSALCYKCSDEPLITTWCVLTETSHLLLQRSANTYVVDCVILNEGIGSESTGKMPDAPFGILPHFSRNGLLLD
ncbi:hypothetical protein LKE08_24675, partial [Lyngbya sp. CCY1209]|nr:hypothetical protein [Lyngbya sp. CCY1209]